MTISGKIKSTSRIARGRKQDLDLGYPARHEDIHGEGTIVTKEPPATRSDFTFGNKTVDKVARAAAKRLLRTKD